VKLPASFDGQCDEGYSVAGNNSLLDVMVGGCKHTVIPIVLVVTVVKPTQPDGPTAGAVKIETPNPFVGNAIRNRG